MQSLWAKLLAGEVSSPGSFSLRTMQVLASMSAEEAQLFSLLCSFTFKGSFVSPLFLEERKDWFKERGLNWAAMKVLEDAGLVHDEPLGIVRPAHIGDLGLIPLGKPATFIVALHSTSPNSPIRIRLGTIGFTRAGRELANLWDGQPNREHAAWILSWLSAQGFRAEQVSIQETDGGTVTAELPPFFEAYLATKGASA